MKIAEGTINFEGTDCSFLFLENTYNIEVVSTNVDIDGILEVTINQNILNPSAPPRVFLTGDGRMYIIANAGGANNIFYIFRKDLDGTPNFSQTQGLFEIHTLVESLPTTTNRQRIKRAIEILKTIV